MNTTTIREQLHQFIELADDQKVQSLYLLVSDDISAQQPQALTDEQMQLLDEEWEKHVAGNSPSYSWEKAKKIIRAK